MKRIAILASGEGTNAENLIRRFSSTAAQRVTLVVSNRAGAPVLGRAGALGVETAVLGRGEWQDGRRVVELLGARGIDAVVLAGFLLLLPPELVRAYEGRIVNIHPALLPLHAGKGMYGLNVHRSVLQAGETETGITIHLVDARYDHGRVLFQARCPVAPDDTPESLQARVHRLEYEHFPRVVEQWLASF